MEERRVTVEGVTRPVPEPFLVIATQNPQGSAGTQLLPEAQVDRFMVSLSVGYPDYDSELAMVLGVREKSRVEDVVSVLQGDTLRDIQNAVDQVYLKENVGDYIVRLVRATREHPELSCGGSPRASIALVRMSRAAAFLNGRDYVIPSDVEEQFPYIIRHRITLDSAARMNGRTKDAVIGEILQQTRRPSMGMRR